MCGCKTGGVGNSIECPNCGKKFRSIGGVKQKACPFCKSQMKDQAGLDKSGQQH